MAIAPYPGLNPDLWDLVLELAQDPNPVPEHLRPIKELREAIRRVEAKRAPLPKEILARDEILSHRGNEVPVRFYSATSQKSPTVMVYFHGGGWSLGGLDGHDKVCADIALQTGLSIVSVDYALAPENPYPCGLEDCMTAVRALYQSGVEIWLGGDSAGANLALGTALRLRDAGEPTPNGMLLFYPALDPDCAAPSHDRHANAPYLSTFAMKRHWAEYLGDASPDAYAAPMLADLTGLPATFVQTAELDPLVDEGNALAKALQEAGVQVWHEEVSGVIHGFIRFCAISPTSDAAIRRAALALKAHLGQV